MKTSILNIVAGLDALDSGQVIGRKGIDIAYGAEETNVDSNLTIEKTKRHLLFNSTKKRIKPR